MQLHNPSADVFVPDGGDVELALSRTTHLCIGAHPDDLEIMGYHGISECFDRPDSWFTGVVVTDGSRSPRAGVYSQYQERDMKSVRKQEQRKAARIGKYSAQIQLDYSSPRALDTASGILIDDLQLVLEKTTPSVLYLHNPADKHDTHVAVLLRCIEAVRRLEQGSRPNRILGCEVWRSLDWLLDLDKEVLSVSSYPDLAGELIRVFDSQIAGGKRYDLATLGRRMANATFLESGSTDKESAVSYALDLMPLVENEMLSVEEYAIEFVDRLRSDIEERIRRVSDPQSVSS